MAPIHLRVRGSQATEGTLHCAHTVAKLVRVAGAVASVAGGSLLAPIIGRHWPQLTESVVQVGFEKGHGVMDWCGPLSTSQFLDRPC